MLIRVDTLQPWAGERLPDETGILYPPNIGDLWTSQDLRAIGLAVPRPFVPVEGKIATGAPFYMLNPDGSIGTGYALEDAPAPAVPASVSARQFWLGCDREGIYDEVKAYIDQQPRAVQLAAEYSASFLRNDPMMQAGFAALGKQPQDIDAFFTLCAGL